MTPNRTPPGQSIQKSSHHAPLRATYRHPASEETGEHTIRDGSNRYRIVPPDAKPGGTEEEEIHKRLEWLKRPFCHKFSLLLQAALSLGRRLRRRLGRAVGAFGPSIEGA
jgi:hypothetical protein